MRIAEGIPLSNVCEPCCFGAASLAMPLLPRHRSPTSRSTTQVTYISSGRERRTLC
jgi:hypothetical protein